MKPAAYIAILMAGTAACGQVGTYEGDVFPESAGWDRVGTFDADRWIDGGWFGQYVDLGEWAPGPRGEADYYQRSIAEFAGASTFFVEWRVETNVPSALFDVSGVATALVAGGRSTAFYHFTLTDESVRLIRSNFLPIIFAQVMPVVPHTYRLELYGSERYAWSIDGQMIDSGVPAAAYPADSSVLIWGTSHDVYDNIARWDYIRFGVIPVDGSGDYDSNAEVTLDDFYFFQECLSNRRPGLNGGPGNDAGPGCRFADFDFDDDVDLRDVAEFQTAFGASR